MSEPASETSSPSESDLEKATEIRAQIEALKAEAVGLEGGPEPTGEVAASVVRNVPEFEVEVAGENVVSYGEDDYGPGDTLTLDGPTAMSLASLGYVTIKGVKAA